MSIPSCQMRYIMKIIKMRLRTYERSNSVLMVNGESLAAAWEKSLVELYQKVAISKPNTTNLLIRLAKIAL